MPTFGERLKELRKERKLTQLDIAQLIGVTDRTIRSYERNEHDPTLSQTKVLADFFSVPLQYLAGDSDDRKSSINEPVDKIPPEETAFFTWVQEHVTGMAFYDMKKAMENEEWLKGLRIVYEREKGRKPGQKQGE